MATISPPPSHYREVHAFADTLAAKETASASLTAFLSAALLPPSASWARDTLALGGTSRFGA